MSKLENILHGFDDADNVLAEKIENLDSETLKAGGWNKISKSFKQTAANTLEYTGISLSVPSGKFALVVAVNQYNNSEPVKIVANQSETQTSTWREIASGMISCSFILAPVLNLSKVYFWTSHNGATTNDVVVYYKYI